MDKREIVVVESLISYVNKNPLTIFNTLLLIATIVLSFTSYRFQVRTGIRESLEQLDDVEFYKEKLKPILHKVEYFPFLKSKATVHLKYYQFGRNPASANQPIELFNRTLSRAQESIDGESKFSRLEAYAGIQETLNDINGVEISRVDGSGIYIVFDTVDAVAIRDRTDTVLTRLKELHTRNHDRFKQHFNIESLGDQPQASDDSEPTIHELIKNHAATFGLCGFVIVVFAGQILLTNRGEFQTVREFSEWLFLMKPKFGWTFAPFLHRGFFHFFRNIVLIVSTGYFAERHISQRVYLIGMVGIGYVSTVFEALYLLVTEGGPVMVIGASGIALAVVTYTGVHFFLSHRLLPSIDGYLAWVKDYWERLHDTPGQTLGGTAEYLAMLIGLIYPLVQIVSDWTGLLASSSNVAGIAHLAGIFFGVSIAVMQHRGIQFSPFESCESYEVPDMRSIK